MNPPQFIRLFPVTIFGSLPWQLTAAEPGTSTQTTPLSFTILMLLTGALAAAVAYWVYQQYVARPSAPRHENPFSEQCITQTFISALPSLTRELNLEVATSLQTEMLERSDTRRVLGINLGTNLAQIRMPVTYRYHIRLQDPWCLRVQGKSVLVQAPLIRPSQPPAIHTDQMRIESRRGWCRSGPYDVVQQLHHDLTPTLCLYAQDPRRLAFVRETARQSVAEFVRLWLKRESRWNRGRFTSIQVQFADEKTLPAAPTLQLAETGAA